MVTPPLFDVTNEEERGGRKLSPPHGRFSSSDEFLLYVGIKPLILTLLLAGTVSQHDVKQSPRD
jgi:hypothetical protein